VRLKVVCQIATFNNRIDVRHQQPRQLAIEKGLDGNVTGLSAFGWYHIRKQQQHQECTIRSITAEIWC
jgi:hypothetical protein